MNGMDSPPEPVTRRRLDERALEQIAGALADSYDALYEEPPVDPRVSLTGDMLAFVFEDGLSVADKVLLRGGRAERLGKFRRHFFEVADGELAAVVTDLTGALVTYSFYGFDAASRTTHGIFILDLDSPHGAEERQAVISWSEQVRRNAARLRQEHRELMAYYEPLKQEWRAKREELRRRGAKGELGEGSGDR